MKSKNPKTLNAFYFLYVFGFFYLCVRFNIEFSGYVTDLFKLFVALFWLLIFGLIYGCILIFFHLYVVKYFDAAIFKHFDAAIEFIEKAWPYAVLIVFLAFMLYVLFF